MMPEDSTRRCRSRGFGCWSPPPMRPRPAGSSPSPTMTPRVGRRPASQPRRPAGVRGGWTLGPGITPEFPVLTDEQVAIGGAARNTPPPHGRLGAVRRWRPGLRLHRHRGRNGGRPATGDAQRPRDPDRNPGPGALVADPVGSGAGAPTNTHGAVAAGDLSV